jgi:hypothetical protein
MASKQQEQTKRYTAIAEAIYVLSKLQILQILNYILGIFSFFRDFDRLQKLAHVPYILSKFIQVIPKIMLLIFCQHLQAIFFNYQQQSLVIFHFSDYTSATVIILSHKPIGCVHFYTRPLAWPA